MRNNISPFPSPHILLFFYSDTKDDYYTVEAVWLLVKLKDKNQGSYIIEGRVRTATTTERAQSYCHFLMELVLLPSALPFFLYVAVLTR